MSLVLSFLLSLSKGPVEGLQYWFMLPIAVLIATTAMASGVGGATFFHHCCGTGHRSSFWRWASSPRSPSVQD